MCRRSFSLKYPFIFFLIFMHNFAGFRIPCLVDKELETSM
jgi:hypothetical protein